MTDKYSFAKCEQYGRRLAARLCDQHFNASPDATLDGPAVLGFTPIRQLNLFVVRQLLQQWQIEMSRLRSSYFDFEAPVVQQALLEFQNTLSRYIRLHRAAFEPLLAKAVADALNLVIDPASVTEHLFFNQETETTVLGLRDQLRYVDINKPFFASFIATLPSAEALSINAVTAQLRAYQATTYRSEIVIQQLVSALSTLLPLTEADLWQDGPTSTLNAQPAVATLSTSSEDAKAVATYPKENNNLKQSESAPTPPTTDLPLHEKLKASSSTAAPLAATLRAQSQPVLLAERNAPKVETLREAISINQRFSFINELFNGENMEYHAAIQHLDSLTDYEQAKTYLTQHLAQRHDWSRKEEHIAKLLKLIERKYAQN